MLSIINALAIGFLWGIRRGASSCLALCIPSIVPTLVEERGDWKSGLKIGLWFNAPRIILLTLLGAVIGAGGYLVKEGLDDISTGSSIWSAGYAIVGCMMIVYGTFVFASVSERLERNGEMDEEACGPAHPLLSRFNMITPKSRTGLFLWGGLVSIACIGETVLALETVFIGIMTADVALTPLSGALLGALAFFLFALGTSVPSLLIASFSTTLADKEKRQARLLQIERISGILMIIFGGILLMTALFVI